MKSMKDLMSLFEMDSDKKEDSKECKTCKKDPCKCDTELDEALMREYKHYVGEALPQGQPAPAGGQAPQQPAAPAQPGTAQAGAQTQAQKPAAPAQPAQGQAQPAQPAAGGQPAKPVAPAQGQTPQAPASGQPAQGQQPPQGQAQGGPGGSATPPNPQQVKQSTDQVTKILNNPSDPMNAELQALLKKAGMMPK
jgi:hypothetical protein